MTRKKRGRGRRMKRRAGGGSKVGMAAGSGNQACLSDPSVKEKTQTVFGQWFQRSFREARTISDS